MKKPSTPSVSLVIPLYNNKDTLIAGLNQCLRIMNRITCDWEIIVCDDKSTDSSPQILKQNYRNNKNIKLIFHAINCGIAPTIKELYRKAKGDFVALFSIDGDWDPGDLDRLIRQAIKQNTDIVIGQRIRHHDSLYRRAVSAIYNTLVRLLFSVNSYDAGSIKVIKTKLLKSIPTTSVTPFFEAELIIKAAKSGAKILAIPISYKKTADHKGHGGNLKLVIATFLEMLKLRLRRIG